MDINKKSNGSELTIGLAGRLDTTTSPQLEEELNSSLKGVKDLCFDLKELEYISSAGLRVILTAQKKMNAQGTMKIKNVSDTIKEIFDMTGFSDIMTIV
jgi:anti-sigma B factor antagonist